MGELYPVWFYLWGCGLKNYVKSHHVLNRPLTIDLISHLLPFSFYLACYTYPSGKGKTQEWCPHMPWIEYHFEQIIYRNDVLYNRNDVLYNRNDVSYTNASWQFWSWIVSWLWQTVWYITNCLTHLPLMPQWIGAALVEVMACRLLDAKPLSKPMLGYCQLDH